MEESRYQFMLLTNYGFNTFFWYILVLLINQVDKHILKAFIPDI